MEATRTKVGTDEVGRAEAAKRPTEAGQWHGGSSDDGSEPVIDADSGISEEEQREILVQINGIAERNRLALSSATETGDGSAAKSGLKAKKNGGFFPIMVNVFAAVVLAGGFFALYALQGDLDVRAREGERVFNSGERALIDEIRRETGALLDAKDAEIRSIMASLGDIESQMNSLIYGNEALTAEQMAMIERLRAQQDEHLSTLATAREERSVILSEARARESTLQAQFDARTREFTAATDVQTAELDAARDELAQISREQMQASAVGDQIAASFLNANRQISEGNFADAERTIESLRAVLSGPATAAFRSAPARRELYVQATESLHALLEESRRMSVAASTEALPPDREAETRFMWDIDRLEAELSDARDAILAGDEGAATTAAQLRGTIATLQAANANLQTANNNLQTTNTNLQTANNNLQTTNNNLQTTNTNLQTANASLTSQVNTLQGNLTQTTAGNNQQIQALQAQNAALSQTINAHEQTIGSLREENNGLNQQLTQIRQVLQDLMAP